MPVYVNKNGQQSGPYEDHVIIDQLRNGLLSESDLGIRHGDSAWRSLGEMFPNIATQPSTSASGYTQPSPAAAPGTTASATSPARKGGCLKWGLLGTGLMLLVLGIAVAAGSRFIPSTSCNLAKADEERIDKLERDIEKAKSDFKYDRIGPLAIELEEATAGYDVSKKYCDDDKFRDDMIGIAGAVMAFLGLLMAVVGLFVGRGR